MKKVSGGEGVSGLCTLGCTWLDEMLPWELPEVSFSESFYWGWIMMPEKSGSRYIGLKGARCSAAKPLNTFIQYHDLGRAEQPLSEKMCPENPASGIPTRTSLFFKIVTTFWRWKSPEPSLNSGAFGGWESIKKRQRREATGHVGPSAAARTSWTRYARCLSYIFSNASSHIDWLPAHILWMQYQYCVLLLTRKVGMWWFEVCLL